MFLNVEDALFLAITTTTLIPVTFHADHGHATLHVAGLAVAHTAAVPAVAGVPVDAVVAGVVLAVAGLAAVATTHGAKSIISFKQ